MEMAKIETIPVGTALAGFPRRLHRGMRGFANRPLSLSERVERIESLLQAGRALQGRRIVGIEERAGAFGASALSLSWLLPLGVVRPAPDVAGGMSSPAGDPISSSAPVIVSRRLGRLPASRFAVQCCCGRAVHGQHLGQLGNVRSHGPVRARRRGRRRGSGHGLGFPLCFLWRQELSPGGACLRRFPLGSPQARSVCRPAEARKFGTERRRNGPHGPPEGRSEPAESMVERTP